MVHPVTCCLSLKLDLYRVRLRGPQGSGQSQTEVIILRSFGGKPDRDGEQICMFERRPKLTQESDVFQNVQTTHAAGFVSYKSS